MYGNIWQELSAGEPKRCQPKEPKYHRNTRIEPRRHSNPKSKLRNGSDAPKLVYLDISITLGGEWVPRYWCECHGGRFVVERSEAPVREGRGWKGKNYSAWGKPKLLVTHFSQSHEIGTQIERNSRPKRPWRVLQSMLNLTRDSKTYATQSHRIP